MKKCFSKLALFSLCFNLAIGEAGAMRPFWPGVPMPSIFPNVSTNVTLPPNAMNPITIPSTTFNPSTAPVNTQLPGTSSERSNGRRKHAVCPTDPKLIDFLRNTMMPAFRLAFHAGDTVSTIARWFCRDAGHLFVTQLGIQNFPSELRTDATDDDICRWYMNNWDRVYPLLRPLPESRRCPRAMSSERAGVSRDFDPNNSKIKRLFPSYTGLPFNAASLRAYAGALWVHDNSLIPENRREIIKCFKNLVWWFDANWERIEPYMAFASALIENGKQVDIGDAQA